MRVLIVEDNADSAEMTATLLRLFRHEVRIAGTGEAALQLIQAFFPDITLLDLGLPGMNGFEVVQQVRALPQGAAMRIWALTGRDVVEEEVLKAGFNGVLIKPFAPQTLIRML